MIKIFKINVLACLVLLGACTSSPEKSSGIGSIASQQQGDTERYLKIDNPNLAKQLTLKDIKTRQVNNHLEANVTIVSKGEYSQQLQYQFTWFDEQGFAVATDNASWWPLLLHGGQVQTLRAVAPLPSATTFNIYVREIHRKAYEFD